MPSKLVTIGLINPKNPINVGSVMRAAGCYSSNAVLYTGKRYDRAAKFNTDTKSISEHIPLNNCDDLIASAPQGASIVCVELVEGATALPLFKHPDNAFYIFGPEDGSVSQDIVDQADEVVYIPTKGCLNLAATVNVLLYDRCAKNTTIETDNDLIKNSRDRNNNVAFKRDKKIA